MGTGSFTPDLIEVSAYNFSGSSVMASRHPMGPSLIKRTCLHHCFTIFNSVIMQEGLISKKREPSFCWKETHLVRSVYSLR